MKKDNQRILYIIGTTGVVYLILRYLLPLVVPFVLAVIVARMLEPAVAWSYARLHFPKRFVSMVLLVVSVGALLVFFGTILVACGRQFGILLKQMPHYQNVWYGTMEELCCCMDGAFGLRPGLTMIWLLQAGKMLSQRILPGITGYAGEMFLSVGRIGLLAFIFFIATIMVLSDREKLRKEAGRCLIYQKLQPSLSHLKTAGYSYLKA